MARIIHGRIYAHKISTRDALSRICHADSENKPGLDLLMALLITAADVDDGVADPQFVARVSLFDASGDRCS
jgi:hypothetical protein